LINNLLKNSSQTKANQISAEPSLFLEMDQKKSLKRNNQLNITAIMVPITVSVMLLLVKTYGYFITDSLSILSSLLDSMMDIVVSVFNMVAVIYASKPADEDHRFGHNSIEDIVGLIQATFIATSAFLILYKAVNSFIEPQVITNSVEGVWLMVFSFAGSFLIVLYQKIILSKTKSVVVESDMMHYLTDVLMNGAIIIALLLSSYPGLGILDPILASVIAFYILWAAIKIGRRSFNSLMDMELEESEKEKIQKLLLINKQIKGYHDLKTRRSGNRVFVQIHIDLDRKLSLDESHDIIEDLEEEIEKIWLQTDVIIHADPV
jgi:ferrous-iron efflux pump FieF